jgi:glycosyltransferase involved in cell wall biosynthesis
MKNKPSLSIAIATHDELDVINRCLDSVASIASEIIVYDASANNLLKNLLTKYQNLTIIKGPNHSIFHLNKQAAIDKCTHNWILQLDADEVVTPQLSAEIVKLISGDPVENGFWMNRQNFFLGKFLKKGGVYPDPTIRLYRRGKGRLPCLDVHEQAEIDGKVGHLKFDLLHYSDPTFSRYLIRNDRYTSLLASQLFQDKINTNPANFINYFFIKPTIWFFMAFIRHKGFVDGFPGFVFAFFSALRFPSAYVKLWEHNHVKKI